MNDQVQAPFDPHYPQSSAINVLSGFEVAAEVGGELTPGDREQAIVCELLFFAVAII